MLDRRHSGYLLAPGEIYRSARSDRCLICRAGRDVYTDAPYQITTCTASLPDTVDGQTVAEAGEGGSRREARGKHEGMEERRRYKLGTD